MESDFDVWIPVLQVHSEHPSEVYSLPSGRDLALLTRSSQLFSNCRFLQPQIFPENVGDPFWRNRFLGCGTVVGGAGDANHSATGRFLVFLLAMSPFSEIFRLPLSRGFYSQNWVFVQKQASVSPGRERSVSPSRERFWARRHHFGPPK